MKAKPHGHCATIFRARWAKEALRRRLHPRKRQRRTQAALGSASPAAAALVDRAAAWRQILPAPPASRRLRIFATDPGASLELNTAFINEATVEVPWEASPQQR